MQQDFPPDSLPLSLKTRQKLTQERGATWITLRTTLSCMLPEVCRVHLPPSAFLSHYGVYNSFAASPYSTHATSYQGQTACRHAFPSSPTTHRAQSFWNCSRIYEALAMVNSLNLHNNLMKQGRSPGHFMSFISLLLFHWHTVLKSHSDTVSFSP